MTKYTEKTYILLTTLSKIFVSETFDIHRDTIAKLLHTDNRIVTQCMRSLKGKHGMIDFNMTDEREYTVTLIKPSQYIYGNFMKYSQEDIKKINNEMSDKLIEKLNERNETIKRLEEQIKNKDEILDKITNLVHYNIKYDREKEVRDEMAREYFLLSKKDIE